MIVINKVALIFLSFQWKSFVSLVIIVSSLSSFLSSCICFLFHCFCICCCCCWCYSSSCFNCWYIICSFYCLSLIYFLFHFFLPTSSYPCFRETCIPSLLLYSFFCRRCLGLLGITCCCWCFLGVLLCSYCCLGLLEVLLCCHCCLWFLVLLMLSLSYDLIIVLVVS